MQLQKDKEENKNKERNLKFYAANLFYEWTDDKSFETSVLKGIFTEKWHSTFMKTTSVYFDSRETKELNVRRSIWSTFIQWNICNLYKRTFQHLDLQSSAKMPEILKIWAFEICVFMNILVWLRLFIQYTPKMLSQSKKKWWNSQDTNSIPSF